MSRLACRTSSKDSQSGQADQEPLLLGNVFGTKATTPSFGNNLYLHGERADVVEFCQEFFAPGGAICELGVEIRIVENCLGLWWAEWESCTHILADSICVVSHRHPDIIIRYAWWGGGGGGIVEYCGGRSTHLEEDEDEDDAA